MKKVVIIHTSFVSVNELKDLFKEIMPSVNLFNIVDDSLLDEIIKNGGITENVIKRICSYAVNAEQIGADLILNQCSSAGEAVDIARRLVKPPFVKIDEAMAKKAVDIGGRISVIATLGTTLGPSVRLIESISAEKGKPVDIAPCLVEGAFDVLFYQNNKEKHNEMVLQRIEEEAHRSDAIVLAQGSMVVLLPRLDHIKVPVLTSPRSGVLRVKEILGL